MHLVNGCLNYLVHRGTDGEKAVLQAIDAALSRASQAEPAFSPEKKKKTGNLLDESHELQRSAFMAARAALKGAPFLQLFWRCLYICCIITKLQVAGCMFWGWAG